MITQSFQVERKERLALAKPQKTEQPVDVHEGIDLRGTLVAVTLLGIFIILAWLGVWSIFISR